MLVQSQRAGGSEGVSHHPSCAAPTRVGDSPVAEGCATRVGDGGDLLCAGEGFPLRSPPVLLLEMGLCDAARTEGAGLQTFAAVL